MKASKAQQKRILNFEAQYAKNYDQSTRVETGTNSKIFQVVV